MVLHYSGQQVVALTVSFTVIAGLILGLRLFTRFFITRNAGLEDGFIAFAMILSIALTATIGEQVEFGMGQHFDTLSMADMIDSLKPFWASVWIYNLGLTFTKISILLQYLRIFTKRQFRIACCALLAFIAAFGVWTFFGSIFLCMPVQFFWDKSIKGGKCMNQFATWFTNAGVNIFQDFALVILPMPMLRSLDIPKRQKRALMLVFALGGFVCLVSILRLQSLVIISNSTDPTFDNPPAATWSSIELNVSIICASLPSLRRLISQLVPSFFGSISGLSANRTRDEENARNVFPQIQNKNESQTGLSVISKTSRKEIKSLVSEASTELTDILSPTSTVVSEPKFQGHARQLTFEHAKMVEITSARNTPTPSMALQMGSRERSDSGSEASYFEAATDSSMSGSLGGPMGASMGERIDGVLAYIQKSSDRGSAQSQRPRAATLNKALPTTPFPGLG